MSIILLLVYTLNAVILSTMQKDKLFHFKEKYPIMAIHRKRGSRKMKQADILQKVYSDPAGFTVLKTAQTETRIWFMGDGVVRIRTSFGTGFPEESLSLVRTAWPDLYDQLLGSERQRTVPLDTDIDDSNPDQHTISCDGLVVTVRHSPFSISCGRQNAPTSFRDVPGRAYTYRSGRITHSFCLDDSSFYGFGEKTGRLEKTGTSMRMSNKDACGYDPVRTDPLYKHIPWFIKLSPDGRDTCGIYYNTSADCTFDIGREYNGYWPRMGQFEACTEEVDLFFVAGPAISDVVTRFCRLTGRPPMLPRYAYGYLGSTMFYSELPENCDREILDFVDKTHRMDIPCTNFHLSSGYTTDSTGKRNVFSWNHEKFPDPATFIAEMNNRGVTVTPNIKPALLISNPLYEAFRQAGAFIRTPDGEPYTTQFWGGKGSFVDFTNPVGRMKWQQYMEENLLTYNISSVWNDNNEFDISDDDAICCNEGVPTPVCQIRARLPMLMNITTKQLLERKYPDLRLYQVTRSGNTGIGRYAQTWTGDNYTSWESLRYNIATMLGCCLSGIPLTGSDIGGFAGPAPGAELLVRWIWCGVLLPRFSIHSANNDNTVTVPWMYPEQMDAILAAFRLRSALLPYFYSLGAQAHITGEPILRPQVYEFPQDHAVRHEDVDFMLGDGLLAACVVEEGAEQRTVYLPKDEIFYDYYTRKRYVGGQIISVPAPLNKTPLFQRGGSIIALQEDQMINLWICPDKDCSFILYEDDGITNTYQQGNYSSTKYTLTAHNDLIILSCEKCGSYTPSEKIQFHFQFADIAPAEIIWNGRKLPQILDEERFDNISEGWHIFHSTKICSVKCKDGRRLDKLIVSYGRFDLIRMDFDK